MSNKIGPETLYRQKNLDYMEIDVRRALENVGYVLLEMPKFDMNHLNLARDDVKEKWKAILPQKRARDTFFYNSRDYGKRLQKKVIMSRKYVKRQYEEWRDKHNFGKLEIYKIALLRSLSGCERQLYHCDTHELDTFRDKLFDDYYLGAVCAPWKKARMHIK